MHFKFVLFFLFDCAKIFDLIYFFILIKKKKNRLNISATYFHACHCPVALYIHSLPFFLINTDTCKTLGVRGLGVNWGAAQNTVYSAAG